MVQELHLQEIQEVFEKLPIVNFSTPDSKIKSEEIRMINFSLFQTFISKMMNSAYYKGRQDALTSFEEAVETTFK